MKRFAVVLIAALIGGGDGSSFDSESDIITYGRYKPAQDTLRILMVYIRFEDDHVPMNFWNTQPDTADPFAVEPWMRESIDPDAETYSDNYFNLTNYFRTMSHGKFIMIGDVVYVQAPPKSSFQGTGFGLAGTINRHVLEWVDERIDLRKYDNWNSIRNYRHRKEPDGYVDMIYMVYRAPSGPHFGRWGGWAGLFSGAMRARDNCTIRGSFGLRGSGLTINLGPKENGKYDFDVSFVHEFAHYLLGENHPYVADDRKVGRTAYWGIFGGERFMNSVNAYEKEKLGWITVSEITDSVSVPLADFLTTGQAYKYALPDVPDNRKEYFYFENRQRIQSTTGIFSTYDQPTLNPDDTGIFVLHVQEPYLSPRNNSLSSKVAQGNYRWELERWIPDGCGWKDDGYPAFRKLYPDPDGASFRDIIEIVEPPSGGDVIAAALYFKDSRPDDCLLYMNGLDPEDFAAFRPDYTPRLNPYTNPNTSSREGIPNRFAMELVRQSADTLFVSFSTDYRYDMYDITQDVFWHGDIYIERDVTVAEGATLTIRPGARITFADGASLIVHGTVSGNSLSPASNR